MSDKTPAVAATPIDFPSEQETAREPSPDRLPYSARRLNALAEVASLLSAPELRVMLELTAWANQNGTTWASTKTFASRCGMSARNVRRTIEGLRVNTPTRPALIVTSGNVGGVTEHGKGLPATRRVLLLDPRVQSFIRRLCGSRGRQPIESTSRAHTVGEACADGGEVGRRPVAKEGAGGSVSRAQAGLEVGRGAPANEGMDEGIDEAAGLGHPQPPQAGARRPAEKNDLQTDIEAVAAVFDEWQGMNRHEDDVQRLPPEDSIRTLHPTLRNFVRQLRSCDVPPDESVFDFLWGEGFESKINAAEDRPTWTSITRACTRFVKNDWPRLRTLRILRPLPAEASNGI